MVQTAVLGAINTWVLVFILEENGLSVRHRLLLDTAQDSSSPAPAVLEWSAGLVEMVGYCDGRNHETEPPAWALLGTFGPTVRPTPPTSPSAPSLPTPRRPPITLLPL